MHYDGSGRPTITATRSEADFLVYRLGIVIPLGEGEGDGNAVTQ